MPHRPALLTAAASLSLAILCGLPLPTALAQTGSATGGSPATGNVACTADASDASTPEIQQLRDELQELRVELAQLKLAIEKLGIDVASPQPASIPPGNAADTAGSDAAAGSPRGPLAQAARDEGNFGRLQSVEQIEPEMNEQQQQRLEQLRQDVEESEQQVAQAKSQMGNVGQVAVGVGYTGNDDLDERDAQIRAQRRQNDAAQAAQRSEIAAAEELLRTRQQDLQAFQEEYGPYYQIQVQQDGKTVQLRVSPETFETASFDPDLPGIRWKGQLLELKDDQEQWKAESILSVPEESLNRRDAAGATTSDAPAEPSPMRTMDPSMSR